MNSALVRKVSWAAAGILLSGCTPSYYRKSADKEVYKAIQQKEKATLGRTNAFSIETPYSNRKPKDIPATELIEDRTQTNRRVLSLTQALDLAVQHSREYQAQKETLYLAALTLTGARYEFTPILSASTSPQLQGSPTASDVGTMPTQIGVSQLLKTGGTLSVGLANDLVRYFTGKPFGNLRNSAVTTLSVNLTQPLLRGFGQNDPRVESLTQAERNVVYAVRTYSQYQGQFAVNVINDYLGLLGQKDAVRNNYTNYLRRVDTTKYVAARVDRVREADVQDARTAELGAKIGYINSLASYLNELDALKLRMGTPITETLYLDDADLREAEKAGLIPVNMNPDAAFQIAVHRHMDILNAIDRFEDSKRKVRVAADQLKPTMNLFARATLASEPGNDYANFDPNKVRYLAGISIDNIFDKLPERNNYRATIISFESQLRQLVATLDNFKDRIDRGFRTLEQQRQNYLNRQASLAVAVRRVDMEQTLLEAGRAQVRDVREAQDAFISAQNELTDSIVSYQTARLQLLLDIGVLTVTPHKFWLEDPLTSLPATPEISTPTSPRITPPAPTAAPGTPPLDSEVAPEDLAPPNRILEPTQ